MGNGSKRQHTDQRTENNKNQSIGFQHSLKIRHPEVGIYVSFFFFFINSCDGVSIDQRTFCLIIVFSFRDSLCML